jgi:diacylglycerol kinase (ATP)
MENDVFHNPPLVILNPAANCGNMAKYRTLLQQYLAQEQADYVETQKPGEAKDLALHAASDDRAVIVVGGDGSINEVVNGILLANKRVPLGIIAAGSGNDFAWNTLKLPKDPLAAIERAFHGRLLNVDVGRVNGRYVANGFSVGLDADIACAVDGMKNLPLLRGSKLYYLAALRQLLFGYHRCPWLTITMDDSAEDVLEQRYVLVAVSNGPAYGAGFHINPNADCCDGFFDVCTVDYTSILRVLRLFPSVKKGQHVGEPEVHFTRVKRISITSKIGVHMQVDGETTTITQLEAEIIPGALCIRV